MTEPPTPLSDYLDEPRVDATVIATTPLTPASSPAEVREILLELPLPEEAFTIGQSIGVIAPGDPALGQAEHLRLYSIADVSAGAGGTRVAIAVRRCRYIDDYSGEAYDGIASNYLCDARPGDRIPVAGPFGMPFPVPQERDATLILIGSGTGIAPFRALVKHLYQHVHDWEGRVLLLYGARSGLELVYMNDERDDFAQYYDRETFEAFRALSPRPHWDAPIDWKGAVQDRTAELWTLLGLPTTRVYIAGLERSMARLHAFFAEVAGGEDSYQRRRAELRAGGRWVELVY
jgi:ferredoxin--NADP+ reductase